MIDFRNTQMSMASKFFIYFFFWNSATLLIRKKTMNVLETKARKKPSHDIWHCTLILSTNLHQRFILLVPSVNKIFWNTILHHCLIFLRQISNKKRGWVGHDRLHHTTTYGRSYNSRGAPVLVGVRKKSHERILFNSPELLKQENKCIWK